MIEYQDFDLTTFNSYRVKAKCKHAYFPESEEDVQFFFENHKKYILIGSGHNLILSKQYYDIPFLIFNGNFDQIKLDVNNVLEVEAGAMMWDVALFALENKLSGVEVFYDIPSSLGGAVVMNAGASGEEIKDVLVKVRFYDLDDNKIKELNREEISFEYRNSFFQKNKNKIVLKAWLKLHTKTRQLIAEKMESVKTQRWAKQPKEYPNAGSVFKRPEGKFVGPMLDELGLKGFRIGGAQVSEKHSGFIINRGGATGKDILDLIAEVQKRVFAKYQINLEVEQRII